MPQQPNYPLKVFIIWAMANILGISAATVLVPFIFASLVKSIHSVVVSVFFFAVPISLAQWLALRRISRTSILWIFTVPVGILLFFLISELIPDGLIIDDESIAVLTTGYFMIGFAVGLLQWLFLRCQFSGSSLWILGSSVGLGFSFWIILATDLINRSGIISLIIGVIIYIFITGLILVRLLAHPNQVIKKIAEPS